MAADLGENERRETLLEQLKRQLREEEERQQEEQRAQAERQQLLLCVPQAEAQLQALRQQLQQQEHRADAERQRADAERQRAEAEQRRLLERALRAELQLEAVRQELQQLQQQHQQQEKKGQWEAGEALGGQRAPLAAVNVNDQHVGGQERLLHLSPLSRQLRAMQLGRQQQQQQRRAETDGEQLERALHADAPMQQLEAARCRGGPSGRSHQSTRGYGGEELAFSRADRAGGSVLGSTREPAGPSCSESVCRRCAHSCAPPVLGFAALVQEARARPAAGTGGCQWMKVRRRKRRRRRRRL